jgi:hypothetical protein
MEMKWMRSFAIERKTVPILLKKDKETKASRASKGLKAGMEQRLLDSVTQNLMR